MKKRVVGLILGLTVAVGVFGLPPFTSGPDADYLKAENAADFKTEIFRHANGIYEVSAHTEMPGVTPEMVRWWFADYMQTTDHYKRWHPEAHIWMDWENKVPGEYVGASHLVHEYIGKDLQKLRIQFVPPEQILGDVDFREDDVAVCALPGLLENHCGGDRCAISFAAQTVALKCSAAFGLAWSPNVTGMKKLGQLKGCSVTPISRESSAFLNPTP